MKRYFTREEEFLDEFSGCAAVAAKRLGDAWYPKEDCDDEQRRQQQYFLSTGELTVLVFEGAALMHYRGGGFAHVDIILKSSKRLVTVRVKWAENQRDLVAEVLNDRPA